MNELILDINNLIKDHILLKNKIEKLVNTDKGNKYPELHISDTVLTATIEQLYNILRILKRQNKKSNIVTSQIAINLSRHSMASIQRVLLHRRTT